MHSGVSVRSGADMGAWPVARNLGKGNVGEYQEKVEQ